MRLYSPRYCILFVLLHAILFVTPALAQTPVSWWKADGNALDSVSGNNGTLQGGVSYAPGVTGQAFSFDGTNGVVHIPDSDNLKFTRSFTISAYIYVKAYSATSDGSQIFFRGDDRIGVDPYFLRLNQDGTVAFAVSDASDNLNYTQSNSTIALNRWVLVTATLDDTTGKLSLYFGSQLVGQITTAIRPFRDLDPNSAPGIGIGNTQDPNAYNQSFNGLIDEVKVYDSVVAPSVPAPVHTYNAVAIASAPDGFTRLLWDKNDGSATVWNIGSVGGLTYGPVYGPYTGWTARALAAAPDGTNRLLWTNANGQATVWTLNASGTATAYGPTYGPFAGWTAKGLATAPDGTSRLLWTNTNGQATLWTLNAGGSATSYGAVYGPIAGWTAQSVTVDSNGSSRLLWDNTDGRMTVWTLPATGSLAYSPVYGPITGWTAKTVSVGPDGQSRVLWNNTNGSAVVWALSASGAVTSYGTVYGPYGGWGASALSVDGSNLTHLLWANTDGHASVWTATVGGSVQSYSTAYGPF